MHDRLLPFSISHQATFVEFTVDIRDALTNIAPAWLMRIKEREGGEGIPRSLKRTSVPTWEKRKGLSFLFSPGKAQTTPPTTPSRPSICTMTIIGRSF